MMTDLRSAVKKYKKSAIISIPVRETEGDIGGIKHEQASPRFCSEDASAGVI